MTYIILVVHLRIKVINLCTFVSKLWCCRYKNV